MHRPKPKYFTRISQLPCLASYLVAFRKHASVPLSKKHEMSDLTNSTACIRCEHEYLSCVRHLPCLASYFVTYRKYASVPLYKKHEKSELANLIACIRCSLNKTNISAVSQTPEACDGTITYVRLSHQSNTMHAPTSQVHTMA